MTPNSNMLLYFPQPITEYLEAVLMYISWLALLRFSLTTISSSTTNQNNIVFSVITLTHMFTLRLRSTSGSEVIREYRKGNVKQQNYRSCYFDMYTKVDSGLGKDVYFITKEQVILSEGC